MNIEDDAIVINVSKYSETSALVHLFTKNHGLMAGLYKGAFKKSAGVIQPGNYIHFSWGARNITNLGTFSKIDLLKNYFVEFSNDILRLYALQSACALCYKAIPQRHNYPELYNGLLELLNAMSSDYFIVVYIFWEMGLLKTLGFEIDLTKCVVSEEIDNLEYVSPKSGKAVSKEIAEPYKDKLLQLPKFLISKEIPTNEEILQGLKLTGYFIEKSIFNTVNKTTPEVRSRLVEEFRKLN